MTKTLSLICAISAAIAFLTLSLALYGPRDASPLDIFKMVFFGSLFGWAVWSRISVRT